MNKFTVAVLLCFFTTLSATGQESDTVFHSQHPDSLQVLQHPDSVFRFAEENFLLPDSLMTEPVKVKSPSRALMLALVLPGLGQAYNGKYWKMPIVWAALGGVGYAAVYNTREYEQATIDYILEESSLNEQKLEYWKRNMEYSYIIAIAVYGLQILDAYVDAHLYSWNVNDNLSLGISPSIRPMMDPNGFNGLSGGLSCSINFKGR
ncbi:MAG: DUF5683 domain-containing protein [Bacteroidales bacterium]|nr:DUF5683 domain-containing protein [Bacteroidales bacterium]